MNWKVPGYGTTGDGYLSLELEFLSKEYLLPTTHNDFCIYTVAIADAAYKSVAINLYYEEKGPCFVNEITYKYLDNLSDKIKKGKETKFPKDIQFETVLVTIKGFSGDDGEFTVEFENIEEGYSFKTEYPNFLNWVYMIANSFKVKSKLEISYIKGTYEIVDIRLPKDMT